MGSNTALSVTVSGRVSVEMMVDRADPVGESHSTNGRGNPVVMQLRRNDPSSLGVDDTTTLGSPAKRGLIFEKYTLYDGVQGNTQYTELMVEYSACENIVYTK